ncbi:hypothetical protein L345_17116, partial [Ophiophagus hannah]
MTGDNLRVSQSSVSRCLDAFLEAMLRHVHEHITFPTTDSELRRTREAFFDIAGFPNVIGIVDCTHVPIIAPADMPALYRNCHNFHSLNVQATCDASGCFTHVLAKFPGSVHDARIFQLSQLQRLLESWPEGKGWLLGVDLTSWASPQVLRYRREVRRTGFGALFGLHCTKLLLKYRKKMGR